MSALTPDEWAGRRGAFDLHTPHCDRPPNTMTLRGETVRITSTDPAPWLLDTGWSGCDVQPSARLALAALCLSGYFTREEAESVWRCAAYALIEAGVCPECGADVQGQKCSNPPVLLPCGHRPRLGVPNADRAAEALRAFAKIAALLPEAP